MYKEKKIGLALSGGGFRAAAFHLGTLKKLHQLNVLDKVDVISTISGGAIIGAAYCLSKYEFREFEKNFKQVLKQSVIRKILMSIEFWFFIGQILHLGFLALQILWPCKTNNSL